ncbi:hypothetical protein Tco_0627268, partial [Tanacetum coccineum]
IMKYGCTYFGGATTPGMWLQPWCVFGSASIFAMSASSSTDNICDKDMSKPVSWRGDHVVAAMVGYRYRFYTRRSEPPYKRRGLPPTNLSLIRRAIAKDLFGALYLNPVLREATVTRQEPRAHKRHPIQHKAVNIDSQQVIMEYLVNISKRRAFWSLNEDILKINILKTNTPYPSRKIRSIRACTHQRPQRNEDQYDVSRRSQYAVLKIEYENILEDIKRGPYSKKL